MAAVKSTHGHTSILLSIAVVKIENDNGDVIRVRALLDSASQSSFITESCAKRFRLSSVKGEE